jgi:hypothetical protein
MLTGSPPKFYETRDILPPTATASLLNDRLTICGLLPLIAPTLIAQLKPCAEMANTGQLPPFEQPEHGQCCRSAAGQRSRRRAIAAVLALSAGDAAHDIRGAAALNEVCPLDFFRRAVFYRRPIRLTPNASCKFVAISHIAAALVNGERQPRRTAPGARLCLRRHRGAPPLAARTVPAIAVRQAEASDWPGADELSAATRTNVRAARRSTVS